MNYIRAIEKEAELNLKLRKPFQCLVSVPGIGNILALTIMLEIGDIRRFNKMGNYSSYCRCVSSKRFSNGKSKGKGNIKNGNKYLAWAYVEAANLAIRHCPYALAFYQRKRNKAGNVPAIKALANKLTMATYYIIRDQVTYDSRRLFG